MFLDANQYLILKQAHGPEEGQQVAIACGPIRTPIEAFEYAVKGIDYEQLALAHRVTMLPCKGDEGVDYPGYVDDVTEEVAEAFIYKYVHEGFDHCDFFPVFVDRDAYAEAVHEAIEEHS